MKNLGLNEIRELFLSYFERKDHFRMESFPLVPQNDKSLLLINAGMAPLKPYFTGEQVPPSPRVTTCQKCIRTPDIENVGKTARHGTYFEMLGNFSFGDYFKKEAAKLAWEFITKELEMPLDKLWVSVYTEDDEANDIWVNEVGVDQSHIFRMGKKDNFWEIGMGPCGPCSEIYFDRGEKFKCDDPNCAPGCDCDRYMEFWNLVFTQFYNDGQGNYTQLDTKNIDTGMGLERLAIILQGVNTFFDVDTMQDIMSHVVKISGVKYGESYGKDVSLRVITDHIRSTVMLICDGVIPSNDGRGYVLRRLLRRAVRHGRLLGITDPFLTDLCNIVINCNKIAYPQLVERQDYIRKVITMEEERFGQTLESGMLRLEEIVAEMKAAQNKTLSGDEAFRLYDTFGFPIDLTIEIMEEKGLFVDRDGFDRAMKEQRIRAKNARTDVDTVGWEGDGISLSHLENTVFKGYDELECKAKILAIVGGQDMLESAGEGDTVTVVTDESVFYAESGGQTADHGLITTADGACVNVLDVKKTGDGKELHIAKVESGIIAVGDEVTMSVCKKRRQGLVGAHSATHLLHEALKQVLGTHVQQAGSLVEPYKLRFDFTHFSAVTPEEIAKVEEIVNEKITEALSVSCREMAISQAKEMGATALFGEKYGMFVRVVSMDDFSVELCGGTHVDNTSRIGCFKIVSENSVASGIRRIEAVTGRAVMEYVNEKEALIMSTAEVLKTAPADISRRAGQLVSEIKEFQRQIDFLDSRLSELMSVDLFNFSRGAGDLKVIAVKIDDSTGNSLRNLSDTVRGKAPNVVCVLATVTKEGKINFAATCGEEAVRKGAHAGNILKEISKLCGGGGGGRADSATAGGTKVDMIEKALEEVNNIVERQTMKK